MSIVLSQPSSAGKGKMIAGKAAPVAIQHHSGQPSTVTFADGVAALASCLRCFNAPCMHLSPAETSLSAFPDFPADRRANVCASEAITEDPKSGAPVIRPDLCMYCGVCASRCPVGAIYIATGRGAIVQDAPNNRFVETDNDREQNTLVNLKLFQNVKR